MTLLNLLHVQVDLKKKIRFGNDCFFPEKAQLLGEHEVEAPSLPEPVVVGEACGAGIRGRFVLIQRDTGEIIAFLHVCWI